MCFLAVRARIVALTGPTINTILYGEYSIPYQTAVSTDGLRYPIIK
jgi:hypothetical protein